LYESWLKILIVEFLTLEMQWLNHADLVFCEL